MVNIKILTNREKSILYITIFLIGFSIFFTFIFLPIMNGFRQLNQKINSVELKLKKATILLGKRQNIEKSYEKFALLTNGKTGEDYSSASMLSEVESLANKNNLRIVDIRPKTEQSSRQYGEFFIELKQEGKANDFFKFIYELENPPYFLRIKKAQLMSKNVSGILDGDFSIYRVYSAKD